MIPLAPSLRRLGTVLGALAAASFAFANAVPIVTLLDEAFPADSRLVENLPTTAAWYGSTATTLVQPAAGSLVAQQVGANMHLFTHFAPSGSPYNLAVDETLNISFNFNLTKAAVGTASIRIGVLNSQGIRVTDDLGALANANFNTDRGYALFFSPNFTGTTTTPNNLNLRVRNVNNQALFSSATPWTSMVNAPGDINVTDARTYSVLMKVTRTASGATISAEISGGELGTPLSITTTTTAVDRVFTSFDMFGIALLSTAATGTTQDPALLTLTNVKVTATMPPLPPPPPPPAENTLFLDETFPAGQRTVESLPATAAWYGSNSTLEQLAAGSIRTTLASATNQHVFAHFRPTGQPYTLTEGEKLTVKFNVNLTKAVDIGSGLRLGLLNSNGTRVLDDTSAVSNGNFANDRGYGFYLNPLNTDGIGGLELRARTANDNQLLTAAGAWPTVFPLADSPLVMAANQTYALEFSVRRTATGTTLKVKISGGDLAAPFSHTYEEVTSTPLVSFDKFAIGLLATAHSGTAGDPAYLTLSNVNIAATTLPDELTSAQLFATWAGNGAVTFAGDANVDGLADGMAWLLGAPSASARAEGRLPTAIASAGKVDFLFTMLMAAERGLAQLRLQYSSDLATWTTVVVPDVSGTVGGIDFVLTPDGDIHDVQATVPAAIVGNSGRFFVRLAGELSPAP